MKYETTLWLLLPLPKVKGVEDRHYPWTYPYDKCHGFVVRAKTEEEARTLASERRGRGDEVRDFGPVWEMPTWTSCTILEAEGEPGVILRDFWAG